MAPAPRLPWLVLAWVLRLLSWLVLRTHSCCSPGPRGSEAWASPPTTLYLTPQVKTWAPGCSWHLMCMRLVGRDLSPWGLC